MVWLNLRQIWLLEFDFWKKVKVQMYMMIVIWSSSFSYTTCGATKGMMLNWILIQYIFKALRCVCRTFRNPLPCVVSECEEWLYLCAVAGFPVNLLFPANLISCSRQLNLLSTYGNFLMNCGKVGRCMQWFWGVESLRGQVRHVLDTDQIKKQTKPGSRSRENTLGSDFV